MQRTMICARARAHVPLAHGNPSHTDSTHPYIFVTEVRHGLGKQRVEISNLSSAPIERVYGRESSRERIEYYYWRERMEVGKNGTLARNFGNILTEMRGVVVVD